MYSQINTLSEADMEFDRQNSNIKHPKKFENEEDSTQIFAVEQRMSFTSDRKRMSILVRDPRDERVKLYTKGADSEIKKRMKEDG